ncbi:SpoIIIAH-like family protein [Paenibacillus jiagnxiensis]|uniref:SpoIIIAH-like family protein n=1 Tax=Paenibacillus jiagnxiensis TaxID=3228926 RepID=UPI0033B8F79B
MNNKRQTIWLVSMLSLMVVLSAYYLFTEDTGTVTDPVADSTQVMDGGTTAAPGTGGSDELTVNEVVTEGADAASGQEASGQTASGESASGETASNNTASNDAASNDTASNDTASGTGQAATEGDASKGTEGQTAATGTEGSSKSAGQQTEVAKTDEQVLEEVKAGQQAGQEAGPEAKETAAAVIDDYLFEREVNNQKKQEELMAAMNDKSSTEAAAAQKELTALEDKQAKITGIEEELEQQFASAVVKEEDNDVYKVVVLSDKMDAKQAVSIVDKVMKELNVTQDKIKVQYVSE